MGSGFHSTRIRSPTGRCAVRSRPPHRGCVAARPLHCRQYCVRGLPRFASGRCCLGCRDDTGLRAGLCGWPYDRSVGDQPNCRPSGTPKTQRRGRTARRVGARFSASGSGTRRGFDGVCRYEWHVAQAVPESCHTFELWNLTGLFCCGQLRGRCPIVSPSVRCRCYVACARGGAVPHPVAGAELRTYRQ